ncbi:Oidioi.mRNA.OKI2018_I69.PAR.g10048.t1.cds, partial [Oikopleura dioica]
MQNRGIFVENREGKDPWTDKGVPGDWITELKIGDLGATRSLEEDEVLIKVKAVGICGSDVHYWTQGRGARFAVDNKMVLGHEGAGEIIQVGSKVSNVVKGDRVAFEPGYATGDDELTKNGRYNLSKVFFCATPPDDGCLCQYFVHKASCCYKMPEEMSYELGAMIEPLSVGIHAAKRARVEPGQDVLITGAGPI